MRITVKREGRADVSYEVTYDVATKKYTIQSAGRTFVAAEDAAVTIYGISSEQASAVRAESERLAEQQRAATRTASEALKVSQIQRRGSVSQTIIATLAGLEVRVEETRKEATAQSRPAVTFLAPVTRTVASNNSASKGEVDSSTLASIAARAKEWDDRVARAKRSLQS